MYGDMFHHISQTDGVVQDIIQKMKKLNEHLLKTVSFSICVRVVCSTSSWDTSWSCAPGGQLSTYPPMDNQSGAQPEPEEEENAENTGPRRCSCMNALFTKEI